MPTQSPVPTGTHLVGSYQGATGTVNVYEDANGKRYYIDAATGGTPRGAPSPGNDPATFGHKPVKEVALDTLDPGNLLHAEKPDLSGLQGAQERAFGFQDTLGNERAAFAGNYNPNYEAELRGRQTGGLNMLADAAAGRVASPAELQLREQAARNAAGAYGLATALQGRSPGAALRSAQGASVATNADANTQAAILRAKETADARNAYIQALSGVRGQEQNLLGADTDWRKALLAGEGNALGVGVNAASNLAQANTQAAGANNIFKGGLLQTGASLYTGGMKK